MIIQYILWSGDFGLNSNLNEQKGKFCLALSSFFFFLLRPQPLSMNSEIPSPVSYENERGGLELLPDTTEQCTVGFVGLLSRIQTP